MACARRFALERRPRADCEKKKPIRNPQTYTWFYAHCSFLFINRTIHNIILLLYIIDIPHDYTTRQYNRNRNVNDSNNNNNRNNKNSNSNNNRNGITI